MNCQQMFAHNLGVVRKFNRLSQAQMSQFLEVKRTTYEQWENGRSQPKIAILNAICTRFKISIHQFLTIDLNTLT